MRMKFKSDDRTDQSKLREKRRGCDDEEWYGMG